MISMMDTILDDHFLEKYEPIRSYHPSMKEHYHICLDLAKVVYEESELAIDITKGNINEGWVTILRPLGEQELEWKAFSLYSHLLFQKYREIMMEQGCEDVKSWSHVYIGCTDWKYAQYKNKIDNASFYEYVNQLKEERKVEKLEAIVKKMQIELNETEEDMERW